MVDTRMQMREAERVEDKKVLHSTMQQAGGFQSKLVCRGI